MGERQCADLARLVHILDKHVEPIRPLAPECFSSAALLAILFNPDLQPF